MKWGKRMEMAHIPNGRARQLRDQPNNGFSVVLLEGAERPAGHRNFALWFMRKLIEHPDTAQEPKGSFVWLKRWYVDHRFSLFG